MSLLDEWNASRDHRMADSVPSPSASDGSQSPLCTVDPRLQFVSQGRGYPVSFSSSNNKLYIATSRNYIIRHDEETGSVAEVDFLKMQDSRIRRLFVDPRGENILILTNQGATMEVYYMNGTVFEDQKPWMLKELKGVNITSVTWYYPGRNNSAGAVLGTDTGVLYGIDCMEHVTRSKKIVKLVEIPRPRNRMSPISGIAVVHLGDSHEEHGLLIMALCGTHLHLYRHLHCQSVSEMFVNGSDVETRLFDLPIEHDAAQLQLFRQPSSHPKGPLEYPRQFAILSASGIYYGKFEFERYRHSPAEDPMDYLVSHKLLPASVLLHNSSSNERPISLALTQYHIVLLFPSKINIINIESRQTVQEIMVDSFAVPIKSAPALPLGLTRDTIDGQMLVLAGDDIYEIDYTNEDRDMWKTFLAKGDFKSALSHCRTAVQRNAVYGLEAERLFQDGDYERAATLFGKLTSKKPTFDEIISRLMGLDEGSPMCKFLEARLETLGTGDRIQSTMISAWLLELLLDRAHKKLLNGRGLSQDSADEDVIVFLKRYVEILDPGATISILQDYGRNEELIAYARARGDETAEVELLIQQGEVERAIQILRKPSLSIDLIYKYSQTLLYASPQATVSLWMDTPQIDPIQLLPAMTHFAEKCSSQVSRKEVIRYLKFIWDIKRVSDPVINDFGISLLTVDDENEPYLLEKLRACRSGLGKPLYDPVRALRLCVTLGRKLATVDLMIEVALWKDAVDAALEFDIELAKSVARRYDGHDEDIQKELWLSIIKKLLSKSEDESSVMVAAVTDILNDSEGSISIDDVLELLPSFQCMGNFKGLICESLNKYSDEVREMKSEIELASNSNTKLRNALSRVAKPCLLANASLSQCASCRRLINERPPISAGPSGGMMPPYYAFPTGNMYHGACLCSEVSKLAMPEQRQEIQALSKALIAIDSAKEIHVTKIEKLKASLHHHIAMEDPFCGENVSRYVTRPFMELDDLERDAWKI